MITGHVTWDRGEDSSRLPMTFVTDSTSYDDAGSSNTCPADVGNNNIPGPHPSGRLCREGVCSKVEQSDALQNSTDGCCGFQTGCVCIQGSIQKVSVTEVKRPGDMGQRTRFKPASTVSCYKMQALLMAPTRPRRVHSDVGHNDRPRPHPSGRFRRVGLCRGVETADLMKERMQARVLLKRFGDLNLTEKASTRSEQNSRALLILFHD